MLQTKSQVVQRYRAALGKRARAGINDIDHKTVHVDDWLDYPGKEFYTPQTNDNNKLYAKFVLDYMRMPSFKIQGYRSFMQDNKLFCTYNNQRYRVTMASRMGTIGLRRDMDADCGYDVNAFVNQCTSWSNKP